MTALEWSGKVVSTRKDKMEKRADYGGKSDGLLEGAGKAIRYVKIGSETDLKKQLFTSWIKQTANANR